MFYISSRPAAIKAMKGAKKQPARSSHRPFDPEELVRRLNLVLAEQHLQVLQVDDDDGNPDQAAGVLLKGAQDPVSRDQNKAASVKDIQSQARSEQRSHSPLKGEQRRAAAWVFRMKPTYSATGQDAPAVRRGVPPNDYTTFESAAAVKQAQNNRRETMRKRDNAASSTNRHTLVLNFKGLNEAGDGHVEDNSESCPENWTRADAIESKPRRLQLLKRISSISVLRARLGGETREFHDEREASSRTQIDQIPEESLAGRRKSVLSLRIRR